MADTQHARASSDSELLVLGSDSALRGRVSSLVRPFVPCTTAHSLEDALSRSTDRRWFGLVLVLGSDDSERNALESLRPITTSTPCAVCIPEKDLEPSDDASRLGSYVLLAHSAPDALLAFVQNAIAGAPEHVQRTCAIARHRVVTHLVHDHGLTKRERQALELSLEGVAQGDICKRLRISSRTLEKHIANMLSKTGDERLHPLVVRCLLRAQELVALGYCGLKRSSR